MRPCISICWLLALGAFYCQPRPSPADSGTPDGGSADGGAADGGATDGGATDGGTDGGSTGDAVFTGPVGPRPLPPTFVPLELDQFPRPAEEACADNTHVVQVSPPATIADALATATPGTTIWVTPGTYQETPGESSALTWSTPNVCLRAADGGTVVLEAAAVPNEGLQKYGMEPRGDDTVIEGFTLRNFGSPITFWEPNRRATLERVRIEGPTAGPDLTREGIVAYGVDGLLLLDVEVRRVDIGVACGTGPCAHWWMERSRVVGEPGSEDSGADAFAVESGRQIVVLDSTFEGASADGIDTKATDVVVFGARVLGVGRNGVKLWHGGDVIDTVIDGTGGDASLVGDEPGRYRYLHVLVARHVPDQVSYVGTWGYDAPTAGFQLEIVNSIFHQNSRGGFFAPRDTQVSFRHTIFEDEDAKLIDLSNNTSDIETAYRVSELAAFQASGRGEGNLLADPQLSAPDARDYSTLPGSPARDAAEVVPELTRDLGGAPRVVGSGPDIGPVESSP